MDGFMVVESLGNLWFKARDYEKKGFMLVD